MWLTELEVDRLRNLQAVRLELPPGLSLISGRNAQGKSSVLEAIYLLGTGRSFRTRKQDELIAWSGGPLRVAGKVQSKLGPAEIKVIMDGDRRSLLADGAEQDLENFLGRLAVVDLTADRLKVLRGGPDERRRFLDRGLLGRHPEMLRVFGEYRRVLKQRNALLRSAGGRGGAAIEAELEVWDERLSEVGARVHQQRRMYTVELAAKLGGPGRAMFPEGEELRVRYRPAPAAAGETDGTEFARIFKEALKKARARDLGLGHTGDGPHRDDLVVELSEIDLRRFGSAGQLRASLICLKLGKLSLLGEHGGESPLFLMDDFDSDLDERRAGALTEYLERGGFQTLVATAKEDLAARLGTELNRVRMEDGVARVA